MIGRVNLFRGKDYEAQNNVVLMHEILHLLGATDKYDLATGQPVWPDGYADPDKPPRFPQIRAEIMGGFIPQGPADGIMPESLDETMIGRQTASEIGWY